MRVMFIIMRVMFQTRILHSVHPGDYNEGSVIIMRVVFQTKILHPVHHCSNAHSCGSLDANMAAEYQLDSRRSDECQTLCAVQSEIGTLVVL